MTVSVAPMLCFLIPAVVLAAVFTIRRGSRTDVISLLLKAFASLCFILLAMGGLFFGELYRTGLLVCAGLVCGLIGDIFLDLKFVYPKDENVHTFTGFAAFMLGHVFFACFLFLHYPFSVSGLLISLAAGIVVGIVIAVTPKMMKLDYGKYRAISSIYAGILVFVLAYSLMLVLNSGASPAKLLFLIGIFFFLLSDLILSQIYFGKDKNTKANKILNHATYYLGQILIALSLWFLV